MSGEGSTNVPHSLFPFDYTQRTRLVFGEHAVDRVGELAAELGAKRVLLVTDRGICAAGHADLVTRQLEKAGLKVVLYNKTRENPTTGTVQECLEIGRSGQVDLIVGLGGGSSLDTAKGCNFLLTNGGRMQDYRGVGKATKPMLPFIAIPTTGGTGSECQTAALIVDESTHEKMACLDVKVAARVAILDPLLTLSQPARVTACTGMDALAHAIETAVTRKRTPLSWMYSREAFRLCIENLPRVLKEPGNVQARGGMLLGAAFAGIAIENSMLGAAHAAANPLTAHFGVVHGAAVGVMLPHVVRFNIKNSDARAAYATLSDSMPHTGEAPSTQVERSRLAESLENLLSRGGLPKTLGESGVTRDRIPAMASEAAKQWTATFNPVPVSESDFIDLYEAAL